MTEASKYAMLVETFQAALKRKCLKNQFAEIMIWKNVRKMCSSERRLALRIDALSVIVSRGSNEIVFDDAVNNCTA